MARAIHPADTITGTSSNKDASRFPTLIGRTDQHEAEGKLQKDRAVIDVAKDLIKRCSVTCVKE